MLVRPGSDCVRPHEDLCKYDSIPVMFPVTFPVTFHFRLYNPDTSVGSQLVPRSDRSKISYFQICPVKSGHKVSEAGPSSVRALRPNSVSDFQYRPVLDIRSVGSVPRSNPASTRRGSITVCAGNGKMSGIWITCKVVFEWKFVALFFLLFRFFS